MAEASKPGAMRRIGAALSLVYPTHCVLCDAMVTQPGALCGACWGGAPFIDGVLCDRCGAPLPGEDDGAPLSCDDCLVLARPWRRGRAALLYRDTARRIVLSLKHGDRIDMVPALGTWMARVARPIVRPDSVVVPVPCHWMRRVARRFNQAELLSRAMADALGAAHAPRALVRHRRTAPQDGKSVQARFRAVADAIRPDPRYAAALDGRPVLLVDDVMTSGATLAAATEASHAAGATRVDVVTLARVVKDA